MWKGRKPAAASSDASPGRGGDALYVERLELDELATHWREALDAASDSLEQLSRSRRALQMTAPELHDRLIELEHERAETELDLEQLARTEHLDLRRHLRGARVVSGLED
jgi:multidrug resistance efflux pump